MSLSTRHSCYILKSVTRNKVYIGYTVNFERRLRQHNGEIKGGAKKTKIGRPWKPICVINGFEDESRAMRFEFRLQHKHRRRRKNEDILSYTIDHLEYLINAGDGSKIRNDVIPWPELSCFWFEKYSLSNVINYFDVQINNLKDLNRNTDIVAIEPESSQNNQDENEKENDDH